MNELCEGKTLTLYPLKNPIIDPGEVSTCVHVRLTDVEVNVSSTILTSIGTAFGTEYNRHSHEYLNHYNDMMLSKLPFSPEYPTTHFKLALLSPLVLLAFTEMLNRW